MGSDLYERIVSQRGSWEGLLTRIPGLGDNIESYFDMSAQRDADRIIRDHVGRLLKEQIARVAQAENNILDQGGLAYMSKTRTSKSRLQTLIDRIITAAPGYAFTGALKVGHAELAEVFAFDEAMLRYVEQVRSAVDGLLEAARSNEGVNEALAALDTVVEEASSAFSLRANLLADLG